MPRPDFDLALGDDASNFPFRNADGGVAVAAQRLVPCRNPTEIRLFLFAAIDIDEWIDD